MNSIQVPPLAEPASVVGQCEANSRPRILVVEDDPDIRRLNTEVLADSGYAVDAAEDGAVAWAALQASNYDLVVTDGNMPRVTGVQLIKKLQAAQMAVPVIMVTGDVPDREFSSQPWNQPAAVLLKPYSFNELLEIVKEVLSASAVASGTIASPTNWPGELARQNRSYKNLAG